MLFLVCVDTPAEGGQGAGAEQGDPGTKVDVRLSPAAQLVEENTTCEQVWCLHVTLKSDARTIACTYTVPKLWKRVAGAYIWTKSMQTHLR